MSKKLKHLVIGLSLCLVVGLGIFAYRSGLFEPAPSEQQIREAILAHIMATTPLVYRNPATEHQIYSDFVTVQPPTFPAEKAGHFRNDRLL